MPEPRTQTHTAQATGQARLILCPGQGAQHVGMGKAWADDHPAAGETYKRADTILGFEVSKVCFEGPEERLNSTEIAQVAIYCTSVACYRAMDAEGRIPGLTATAGLSLGEFTALHLAGAFDFETGLELVRLRGQAMQQAADTGPPGGMVALVGADEQQAADLCQRAADGQVLVPANFNCPGQVVISGHRQACDRAVALAGEMGLKATALKVAGAFHSPLMQPAAEKLAKALDKVAWLPLAVPVLSNVTGRPHPTDHPDPIKARLVEQLTCPVRWSDSMAWAVDNLSGQYTELAPGKVLAGLMRRIDRTAKVQTWAQPESA
jgi:[acyl-carrier-protein] S-malonyltransferase